jgi:hypothetical protein
MHLTGGCFCGGVVTGSTHHWSRQELPLLALSQGLQWLGLCLCRNLNGVFLMDQGEGNLMFHESTPAGVSAFVAPAVHALRDP